MWVNVSLILLLVRRVPLTFDIWMYILDQLKCTMTVQLPIQAPFFDGVG